MVSYSANNPKYGSGEERLGSSEEEPTWCGQITVQGSVRIADKARCASLEGTASIHSQGTPLQRRYPLISVL